MANSFISFLQRIYPGDNCKSTNITIFDNSTWLDFNDIAVRNNTNRQSIIWNFVTQFVSSFDGKPGTTLDDFADGKIPTPSIDTDFEKMLDYLKDLDSDTLEQYSSKFFKMYKYAEAFIKRPDYKKGLVNFDLSTVMRL